MGKIMELSDLIRSKYKSESACAAQMGWPRQRLNKITNGAKEPDIRELNQLAVALECSVEKVLNIFLP